MWTISLFSYVPTKQYHDLSKTQVNNKSATLSPNLPKGNTDVAEVNTNVLVIFFSDSCSNGKQDGTSHNVAMSGTKFRYGLVR